MRRATCLRLVRAALATTTPVTSKPVLCSSMRSLVDKLWWAFSVQSNTKVKHRLRSRGTSTAVLTWSPRSWWKPAGLAAAPAGVRASSATGCTTTSMPRPRPPKVVTLAEETGEARRKLRDWMTRRVRRAACLPRPRCACTPRCSMGVAGGPSRRMGTPTKMRARRPGGRV